MELPVIIGLGHPNAAKVVDNVRSLPSISRQARSFYSPGIKVKRAEYRPTRHYFHATTLRSLVPKLLTMAKAELFGDGNVVPYKSIDCQPGQLEITHAAVLE